MVKDDTQLNTQDLEQAHLDFISTVSHELRTPLTSIRGFADTLISSFDKLSPEQRTKFLNIIKDQSNRLINLIENLLTVSKIQSHKEALIFKSVNTIPFIDSCIQIVKSQYKTHKFRTNYGSNISNVLIDTDKFQQIILNILDNAAKYSPENSIIEICVNENIANDTVIIKIKDNGFGILEKDIPKIFEKFSRIDSPLTRKIQGSGLGLYITKNLVESMKGSITVESSEGSSTFIIEFPIATLERDQFKSL